MIIKRLLFLWLIALPSSIFGQGKIVNESIIYFSDTSTFKKEISSTTLFEVETLAPVLKIVSDTASSSTKEYHYYLRDKQINVCGDISYIGGINAIRAYQDSLYWKHYVGDEMNCTCLYTILFDEKLKIKDVRIIRRSGYDNSGFDFDSLIKKILISTEGKWQTDDNARAGMWYFTLGRFWLR